MELMDLNTGMEVISRAECMELLATEEVGRLAVVIMGRPEIFPVNYVLDGDGIVFRTDRGTKLAAATSAPVAFEVDHLNTPLRTAWSVIAKGRAHQVSSHDSPMLRHRISQLTLYPWTSHDKAHVIRITPQTVTGRRIRHLGRKETP